MEELQRALSTGGSVVAWKDFQVALQLQDQEETALRHRAQVSLENEELWEKFHSITNEMIVTRAGRRMFPLLQVHLSSLDPSHMYSVLLEFQPTHTHRWRFLNGEWQAGSNISDTAVSAADGDQRCMYVHPSSPATGLQWMTDPVTFAKLKLSNKENSSGKLKLSSLNRYQPCVHIVKLASSSSAEEQQVVVDISSRVFPTTQFIAVTAYQNDKITQMKIKHNPFAKAFLSPSQENKEEGTTLTVSTAVASGTQPMVTLPTTQPPFSVAHCDTAAVTIPSPYNAQQPNVQYYHYQQLSATPQQLPPSPLGPLSHYSTVLPPHNPHAHHLMGSGHHDSNQFTNSRTTYYTSPPSYSLTHHGHTLTHNLM